MAKLNKEQTAQAKALSKHRADELAREYLELKAQIEEVRKSFGLDAMEKRMDTIKEMFNIFSGKRTTEMFDFVGRYEEPSTSYSIPASSARALHDEDLELFEKLGGKTATRANFLGFEKR